MGIGLLDFVQSLVQNRLPVIISLARLSVSINVLIHLRRCILAGMLSSGILARLSHSLDDHLGSFPSTFRIGG